MQPMPLRMGKIISCLLLRSTAQLLLASSQLRASRSNMALALLKLKTGFGPPDAPGAPPQLRGRAIRRKVSGMHHDTIAHPTALARLFARTVGRFRAGTHALIMSRTVMP